MSSLRLAFVLAACGAAYASLFSGCGGNGNSPTGSGGGTSGSGGGTGTGGTPACGIGTGGDPTVSKCDQCLHTKCATELSACGPDCYAIQACLDAVCAHLSATASMDEGACQVYCQNLHPAGKAPLIALVNCVGGAQCQPTCAGAPYDYDQCAMQQVAGCCKGKLDACNGSSDCTTYQACAGSCTSAAACEKCKTDTPAGEKLYEDLQLCIDQVCLAEYWLPQF